MPKSLEEYLALPYTIVLRRDPRDEITVARVEELPGCSAHGRNEQEALSNLRDNMEVWIADCLKSGDPVPEPTEEIELPSGKWLQRVPRSLHLKLIRLAKVEGASLNQFITAVLAQAVGEKIAQPSRGVAVSILATGEVNPWSIDSRIDKGQWETRTHSKLDHKRRDHSIRSLLRKIPPTELKSTGRGLTSADQETHENWSTHPAEIASREVAS
jgi:antitoxin HicB